MLPPRFASSKLGSGCALARRCLKARSHVLSQTIARCLGRALFLRVVVASSSLVLLGGSVLVLLGVRVGATTRCRRPKACRLRVATLCLAWWLYVFRKFRSRSFGRLSLAVTPSAESLSKGGSKPKRPLTNRCREQALARLLARTSGTAKPPRLHAVKANEGLLPHAGRLPRRRWRGGLLAGLEGCLFQGRWGNQALKPTQGVVLIRKLCYRAGVCVRFATAACAA